jgi:predicted ATPase/class 3 adenylate cyclase
VTFLFTDVEGSTRLLQLLGHRYADVVTGMYTVVRRELAAAHGIEVGTAGDAFFAVFSQPRQAVIAALGILRGMARISWPEDLEVRVRIGIHTGEGLRGGDDYIGLDVHRAARIAHAAHGGQVLLSAETWHACQGHFTGRDLGFHRLKDLDRPERLFQLVASGLPTSFPPVRSLGAWTNLPAETSSLIGRQAELAAVRTVQERARLLTLTGPGGVGKTRLALRLARDALDRYDGGVYFVSLASVSEPWAVPAAIAQAIGLKEDAGRGLRQVLTDHLSQGRSLLVLDNFEHLVKAAPLVEDLLAATPQLSVVVTSRAPLHLPGEYQFRVPPLPVRASGGDGAALPEAVQLFHERAEALQSANAAELGPAVVEQICQRLDGLPLAIELAARWVKVLAPAEILTRLHRPFDLLGHGGAGVPVRQQTLRAAIGWSYGLLTAREQRVFRGLSVFRGGWFLSDAVAVCEVDDEATLLDIMYALIDKSLIDVTVDIDVGRRFGVLETIREYAAEKLEESGDAVLSSERHAQHMLDVARTIGPQLSTLAQPQGLALADIQRDNIAAALRWAALHDRADTGLKTAGALWRYWHLRSRVSEGRAFFDELLNLPSAAQPTSWRAEGLHGLAGLAYWQEDIDTARACYEEELTICLDLGVAAGIAAARYGLAFVAIIDGDTHRARRLYEQVRALCDALGDERGAADALHGLGLTAQSEGDYEDAVLILTEAISSYRAIGDRFGLTNALTLLGRVNRLRGQPSDAKKLLRDAIRDYEQVGNLSGLAWALRELSAIALTQDSPEGLPRAVRLAGSAQALETLAGGHVPLAIATIPDPLRSARDEFAEVELRAAWDDGAAMTVDEAVALAFQPDA